MQRDPGVQLVHRGAKRSAGVAKRALSEYIDRAVDQARRMNAIDHAVVGVSACGLPRYSTVRRSRSIVTRPGRSPALRDRLGRRDPWAQSRTPGRRA